MHGPGLWDVFPSAAAATGTPGFSNVLRLPKSSMVVVCLVDGLGARQLEEHQDLFPSLKGSAGESVSAPFPTTTSTGLASLGTGLMPGIHGFVGAAFWLPEADQVLSPLRWPERIIPEAVQPESTVFQRIARRRRLAASIGPAAYQSSGLTRSVLRGSAYWPAVDVQDYIDALQFLRQHDRPELVYVYWPHLDRAGHEFGVASEEWKAATARADRLISGLRGVLAPSGLLVVTADHGMVNCSRRMWIESDPSLLTDVHRIAGEPRMRHVYCAPRSLAQVRAR